MRSSFSMGSKSTSWWSLFLGYILNSFSCWPCYVASVNPISISPAACVSGTPQQVPAHFMSPPQLPGKHFQSQSTFRCPVQDYGGITAICMTTNPNLPCHRLDSLYSSDPRSLKSNIPEHMANNVSSSLEISSSQTLTDLPTATSLTNPSFYILESGSVISLFCPKT